MIAPGAGGREEQAAVGSASLAAEWNGSGWRMEKTADPADMVRDQLNDVSCVAARRCDAVGSYTNTLGEFTLGEYGD
jgi:hypothetical protein